MDPSPQDTADVRTRMLRPARPWGLVALLAVLVTGFLLSWHSLTDIDVWFHLRSGQDILAGGGFPSTNHYSFTEPDHPWLNHEWLFQILIAGLGPGAAEVASDPNVTGWNVLRTLLSLALTLLLAWSGGLYRRMQGTSPEAASWTGVVLLAGLFLLWPRLTLRPELLSYSALILVVETVQRLAQGSAPRAGLRGILLGPAGAVLLVTLLWAQLHGFAALAPLVILLAGILAPLDRRWRRLPAHGGPRPRFWGLLVLGCLVALALTPNGPRGLIFPFRALGQFAGDGVDLRRTVSELVPLLESPGTLAWTIKAYLATLLWGVFWILARWRAVSLLRIILFFGAAAAAWTSQRNIGLFAVAFVLLHAPSPVPPVTLVRLLRPAFLKPHWVALWGLMVVVVGSGLWWPAITGDRFYLHEGVGRRFGDGVNPARFPQAATTALAQRDIDRYFANLDGAAFTLARGTGRIFIDGRTEAYSPAMWEEYLAIRNGGTSALDRLAARRVQAVCLTTGSGAFKAVERTLMNSPAWSLVAADGGGLLLVPGPAEAPSAPSAILAAAIREETRRASVGSPCRRADHLAAAARLADLAGDQVRRKHLLEEAVALAPGHPVVLHNLGNTRLAQGDFADAADHFRGALQANPRLAASALNAGVAYSRLGDRKAARRYFRRTVGIDAGSFEGWMNLAVTELALGDNEAAHRAAEKARELRPRARAVQDLLRRIDYP